jgi:S-adenosyl-L-methionine hydrolase (adenosine-forming)
MRIITLTTDFGVRDWFVGTMKGVLLGIQSKAQLIDITHHIPAGDIEAGAFALAAAFRFFPAGTVHLAVVDPGVGTTRAALAVKTANYTFVAPDNGVLSLALAQEPAQAIYRLEKAKYFLPEVSRTFHGRDVFAPVAAHLSRGVSLAKLGPKVDDYVRLNVPDPHRTGGQIRGVVVYIDRFGNAITNIAQPAAARPAKTGLKVRLPGRKRRFPVCPSYQSVEKGQPLGIFGSTRLLEVAVNGSSAARALGLAKGDPVFLEVAGRA